MANPFYSTIQNHGGRTPANYNIFKNIYLNQLQTENHPQALVAASIETHRRDLLMPPKVPLYHFPSGGKIAYNPGAKIADISSNDRMMEATALKIASERAVNPTVKKDLQHASIMRMHAQGIPTPFGPPQGTIGFSTNP